MTLAKCLEKCPGRAIDCITRKISLWKSEQAAERSSIHILSRRAPFYRKILQEEFAYWPDGHKPTASLLPRLVVGQTRKLLIIDFVSATSSRRAQIFPDHASSYRIWKKEVSLLRTNSFDIRIQLASRTYVYSTLNLCTAIFWLRRVRPSVRPSEGK